MYDVGQWKRYHSFVDSFGDDVVLMTTDGLSLHENRLVGIDQVSHEFKHVLSDCKKYEEGYPAIVYEHLMTGKIDVWCQRKSSAVCINKEIFRSKKLTKGDLLNAEFSPWVIEIRSE